MGGELIWEINAWTLLKAGGPMMIPILFCSVFAFGIIIEKLIFFSKIHKDPVMLKEKTFEYLKNNKIKEAIQFCETQNSPVTEVLKAGITKFGRSREEVKESMEDASLYVIPKLESRLSALATIAHMTPLLGLLGTVAGMTSVFHTIQVRSASMNPVTPGDLAGGVSEALITTIAGLMVAIPAFIAYNYCVSRVNNIILEMERASTELVNLMALSPESTLES